MGKFIEQFKNVFVIFFLCGVFFLCLGNVFAKESVNYEWGNYIEGASTPYDVTELENGYVVYGGYYAVFYDNNGEITKQAETDALYCSFMTYDVENEEFVCLSNDYFKSSNGYVRVNEVYLLDNNLKVKEEYRMGNSYFYPDYMNKVGNEYVFIDMNSGETIILNKDTSSMNYYGWEELSTEEYENYWGDYYLFDIAYENASSNKYYYDYTRNDTYQMLTFYDDDNETYGIEIYDNQNKLLLSEEFQTWNKLTVELGDDGYYVLTESNAECSNNRKFCTSQLKLAKYDFSKNLLYEEDLQKVNSIDRGDRVVIKFKKVQTGFIMINDYLAEPSLDQEITGKDPAIIKYSFSYGIETKTDGNGEIKAIPSSKVGDDVTFEITPKEGFVLGVVKVTDANGNVLTFTSNTFTMPSSDVTIEATFLPKNPDTKDIAILVLLLLAIMCGIVFLRNRKKLGVLK